MLINNNICGSNKIKFLGSDKEEEKIGAAKLKAEIEEDLITKENNSLIVTK